MKAESRAGHRRTERSEQPMQHTSSEELRDRMRDYLRRAESGRGGKPASDSRESITSPSAKQADQTMECWYAESGRATS